MKNFEFLSTAAAGLPRLRPDTLACRSEAREESLPTLDALITNGRNAPEPSFLNRRWPPDAPTVLASSCPTHRDPTRPDGPGNAGEPPPDTVGEGRSAEIRRLRAVYARRRAKDEADKTNRGRLLMIEDRNRHLAARLSSEFGAGLRACRALDIGCGDGTQLGWLRGLGLQADRLVGVDLLPHQIQKARARFPGMTFIEGNAGAPDGFGGGFDMVLLFTVFSSIFDDAMAHELAETARRALGPNGIIVWYDVRYPNPFNRDIRPMTRGRIQALFPEFDLDLRAFSLLPPIARKLGGLEPAALRAVYGALAVLPPLRSHYLGLLRPRTSGQRR